MILRGLRRFALLFLGFAAIFAVAGVAFGAVAGAAFDRSLAGGLLAGGGLLMLVALFSAVGGPGTARPFARAGGVWGPGGYVLTDEVRRQGFGELGVFLTTGVGLVLLAVALSELG
jgi:hypothetical protein